jgi:hypothetical protein
MTATPGFKGFGSKVSWGGTDIGYCRDIPFPSMTRDKVDFTNQDSDDEFEESQAGMGHAGEVAFDVIFVPGESGQNAAIDDFLSGTTQEMIITGPTSAAFTWTCNAFVSAVNGQIPYMGEIVMSLTLTLTGKPTLGVDYAPNMSALSLTTATLLPTFAAATYEYTATTTGTSVTVTPTCATADSIEVWAEVSGVMTLISTLSSGGTSSAISAGSSGTNTEIEVKVKKSSYATRITKIRLVKTA